jgi:hypothetical protein
MPRGGGGTRSLRIVSIGVQPGGGHAAAVKMHTISEPGGRARGEQSAPAVGEQLLADGLEGWPASSVGGGRSQSDLVEAVAAAEIGQLKTDAPAVMSNGR